MTIGELGIPNLGRAHLPDALQLVSPKLRHFDMLVVSRRYCLQHPKAKKLTQEKSRGDKLLLFLGGRQCQGPNENKNVSKKPLEIVPMLLNTIFIIIEIGIRSSCWLGETWGRCCMLLKGWTTINMLAEYTWSFGLEHKTHVKSTNQMGVTLCDPWNHSPLHWIFEQSVAWSQSQLLFSSMHYNCSVSGSLPPVVVSLDWWKNFEQWQKGAE